MADEDTYPLGYDDDDRMGDPWCKNFEDHRNAHEFCEDHQISWCSRCDRICPDCIDDPHCPECGVGLLTDEHDWDCSYYGEDDDE